MKLKKGHLELRFSVEFRESDVSPDKTEVEKGKFIELYSLTKDNYRETCKSFPFNLKCNMTTVGHFSCLPLFKGPHFLTKMMESNILYHNLLIYILSV